MSLARRHRDRVLAGFLGRDGVVRAADGLPARALLAANDNARVAGAPPTEGEAAAAYLQQRAQLAAHQRELKLIQSLERKIERKREILPVYDAWIEGALAAGESGQAVQDEVVTTAMVWRIDVGDYAGALRIARHVFRHGLTLPERFERGVAVLVAEEIAEAAILHASELRDHSADEIGGFPESVLDEVHELTAERDMPDEVRAKLFKARGLQAARRAAALEADTAVAGLRPALQAQALEHLRRAYALNDRSGVKAEINRLEKALHKEASDDRPEA